MRALALSLLMTGSALASGGGGPSSQPATPVAPSAADEAALRARCQNARNDAGPTADEAGLLDEQLLLEMMHECAAGAIGTAELRARWRAVLATSEFALGTALAGDDADSVLVDRATPGSKPHWIEPRERGNPLKPWTIDTSRDERRRQLERDEVREAQARVRQRGSRLHHLFGDPIIEQWTLEYMAARLYAAETGAARKDEACSDVRRGYRALHLVAGGAGPLGLAPAEGELLIYALALGTSVRGPCAPYAPRSFGLKPLRHPQLGQEPINRYGEKNLVTVPINPATIDEFLYDNDWIMAYDERVLAADTDEGQIVFSFKSRRLGLKRGRATLDAGSLVKGWGAKP